MPNRYEPDKVHTGSENPSGSHRYNDRIGWNRNYSEGSVFRKLSKEDKKKFEAWLKELDHDHAAMAKWGRRGCTTTGVSVAQAGQHDV